MYTSARTVGFALVLTAAGLTASHVAAQSIPDIPERAKGAERVVVASITHVQASLERNEHGDEVIVSHAVLAVEEVLKGQASGQVTVDVEGGTLNGITMGVSSLPRVTAGERGVFFLTPGKDGKFKPHMRGLGILKLDQTNTVKGSSLTLENIRKMTRGNER